MPTFRRLHRQRGTSVFGLFVIAVVVGFVALMGARVFPALNEYFTIKKAVNKIMRDGPASASDIRKAFESQKAVEYSISSLDGKDLEVTQVNDKFKVHFKYNKEIEIVDPVFLLFKFEGSAASPGTGAASGT